MRLYNFNHGWKFRENSNDGVEFDRFGSATYKDPRWCKSGNNGLAITNYDDSDWQDVKLPHDFVIEKCDFTPEEIDSVGSLRKGFAWYRKTFELPDYAVGQRVFVRFDGVFRDSQVWCNGHFMGRHLGGYLGFTYELTDVLSLDGTNTIAVLADATGYEGWWYEGGGVYRDAWIIVTPDLAIKENSVFAKPFNIDLEKKTCDIDVEFEVDTNKLDMNRPITTNFTYKVELVDPNNKVVSTIIGDNFVQSFETTKVKNTVTIEALSLWDLTNTNMYVAKVTVEANGEKDEFSQKFAIRKFDYSVEGGMNLNGEPIFLKGACGHDDFAGVGTALNKSVLQYKIKCLKDMGCNAYRCSHNPPSPLFLDACDEMGFLVMDETRLPGTSFEMIDDFKSLIKRDRNHPCVVMFSMGNEEMNIQNNNVGINIFNKMYAIGKSIDDSRDYMFAINTDKIKVLYFVENNGIHFPLHGVNYLTNREEDRFGIAHKNHPTCCLVSTESSGLCTVRGYMIDEPTKPECCEASLTYGVWENPATEGIITCYGDFHPKWGITPERTIKEHSQFPFAIGAFLWTGFDYRGEVGPYTFPSVISCYGIIDLCGFFKDWAYHVKAWWGNEPVLHIFPSWNLKVKEGTPISVWAFANCEEVELFLNGKSLGRKTLEKMGHLEWTVNYEKGEVKAIGYTNGQKVLEDIICSSDKEYKLVLKTEKSTIKADCDDNTIITVEVVDKDGKYVTDSTIYVDFEIEGVGTIKGVGNGNPRSLEHDKLPKRKLFAGKAIAIVEGTFDVGEIKLTAKSNGVISDSITINSVESKEQNYIFSKNDVATGKFRVQEIDF